MKTNRPVLCVLAFCTICGQVWSQRPISHLPPVNIEPSEQQEILEDQPYQFVCHLGRPISYCSVQAPNGGRFNLYPGQRATGGLEYFGSGFNQGDCGARVASVDLSHNGAFLCGMGASGFIYEAVGMARLVVKPTPLHPQLTVQQHYEQYNMVTHQEYFVGDTLSANCRVNSREHPLAQITWFIEDEAIMTGVSRSSPNDLEADHVTLSEVVEVELGWKHHGRRLRCVARYPAEGPGGDRAGVAEKDLHVMFAPLPSDTAVMEMPLFRQGREYGVVTAVVRANPRPELQWRLNGVVIGEGRSRYRAVKARELVVAGQWEARLLISEVSAADLGTTFHLTASNELGNRTYIVRISAHRENSYKIGIASIAVGLTVLIAAFIILVGVIAILVRRHRSEVLLDTIA